MEKRRKFDYAKHTFLPCTWWRLHARDHWHCHGRAGHGTGAESGIPPPRTIDQELDHLTKELELTPAQQKEIRPLLLQHQQEIQTLIDKNPSIPREALSTQIHGISDQTHHKINALLTDHQKQLAEAMQARMHNSEKRPPS
jgi:hypothetical protein